jgi:hypothetical protein
MNILMNTFFLISLFLGLSSIQPTITYAQSDKCSAPNNYTLSMDAIRSDDEGNLFLQCDDDNGDHYMVRTDLRHVQCVTIIHYNNNELREIQFHEWSSLYCIEFRKKGVHLIIALE